MYYYYISGNTVIKELSSSTNEDGEVTYTTTDVTVPAKRIVSETEMVNLFMGGTDVYVSYDNETNNTREDALITQQYINGLGTITSEVREDEEVVGADGTISEQTVTYYRIERNPTTVIDSIPMIAFSSVDVSIDSIAGNASFITSLNPTKTNYKLVAVVGWSIAGVSTVVPFRLYIGSVSETLYIGLRNTTSTAVTDKTLTVYLMWQADDLNLENLEEEEVQEEEEQLVDNDAPQDLEEVEDI